MDKKTIYVTSPFLPPIEEYYSKVQKIWENKYLTNQGPMHEEFKNALKKEFSLNNVTLFCNGHLALECALKSLNMRPGGEIITTPFTFISTTHAIFNCGFKPVFCDIKMDDYTIDEDKIESLITNNTVAIVPVHVYGYPCNVEKIDKIAKKYNLKVVYDAAHAFGVNYKNNSLLSYGDISMVSFHATKLFHTIEGGMLSYSDKYLSTKLDAEKNFGILKYEEINNPGINAKMNEFQAAMGLTNLPYLKDIIKKRKHITNLYKSYIKKDGIIFVKEQKNVDYNYAYLPILVEPKIAGITRDTIFEKLEKENIYSRKYFFPLTSDANCYKDLNCDNLDNAKYVSNNILTLPLYATLTDEEVLKICNIINEV